MSQTAPRIAPLEPPYAPDIAEQFDRIMRGAPPLLLVSRHGRQRPCLGEIPRRQPARPRAVVVTRARDRHRPHLRANRLRYEWGVHVATFAAAAHLTEAQVRATVRGAATEACWSEAEQALISAVDALHDRATLSEAEFAGLSAHYDEAQIFEIILLCGFYRTVSYLANGLALPLEAKAARFPT
jgi:hypothetical protein